jgi:uncharacterized protein YdaT
MPWEGKGPWKYSRKAKTAKQKRQARHIAQSMMDRGASEGAAIRAANGVIKRGGKRKKSRSSGRR